MFWLTLWRTFSRGRRQDHTWRSFVDTFVHDPEVVLDKKKVAGFSFATFDENRRALARVEQVYGLVLDFDHGKPTIEKVARAFQGTKGVTYTTFSHTPEAPRLRAILLHDRPVNVEEHDRIWWWAHARCLKAGLEIDLAARDASHFFFLPSHAPGAKYNFLELEGKPLNVEIPLRAIKATPSVVVPCGGPSQATATELSQKPRDNSASGRDWYFALKRMREGASDEEILDELRSVSPKYAVKGESYVAFTVARARVVHEAHAPCMRVRKARFRAMPPRFGHPERRHVELNLMSDDGELAEAQIIVPSPWYASAAQTWKACFPDVDPKPLLARWEDVREAWNQIRWRHRMFEVAVRDGAVKWIRAAVDTFEGIDTG